MPEVMAETHERIAQTVESNIAAGRDWNEGLLLVAGVPVEVRGDAMADASDHIYLRVERFLRWKLRKDYGDGLERDYGDMGDELMAHAVAYALDDLALSWLGKDRHLLFFLRDPWKALKAAKESAWLRAQQELHRERKRQGSGGGVIGNVRPLEEVRRGYIDQRSWSARMSRGADLCYFDMEAERQRNADSGRLLAVWREQMEGIERVTPRRPRHPQE